MVVTRSQSANSLFVSPVVSLPKTIEADFAAIIRAMASSGLIVVLLTFAPLLALMAVVASRRSWAFLTFASGVGKVELVHAETLHQPRGIPKVDRLLRPHDGDAEKVAELLQCATTSA